MPAMIQIIWRMTAIDQQPNPGIPAATGDRPGFLRTGHI
jgi:hypothetical protein